MSRIKEIAKLIPDSLMDRPGRAFYSGRRAFESSSHLYILAANSAKDLEEVRDTVRDNFLNLLELSEMENWSRYEVGKTNFHCRMLELFEALGLNPKAVPASNVVFQRSSRIDKIPPACWNKLAKKCWPFHRSVIEQLGVRVILCMGQKARDGVIAGLQSDKPEAGKFLKVGKPESSLKTVGGYYRNNGNIAVVHLPYPTTWIDWTTAIADHKPLIQSALDWASSSP